MNGITQLPDKNKTSVYARRTREVSNFKCKFTLKSKSIVDTFVLSGDEREDDFFCFSEWKLKPNHKIWIEQRASG